VLPGIVATTMVTIPGSLNLQIRSNLSYYQLSMLFNEVELLSPSVRVATDIIELRAQSLLMSGVTRSIVDEVADPRNHVHVEAQLNEIYGGSRQFFGVVMARRVLAYSEVSEWAVVDQAPFAVSSFERITLQAIDTINDGAMAGRPVGIYALATSNTYEQRLEAARSLVNHAIYHADGKEMRARPVDRDPVLATLLDAEFKATPKHAHIDGIKHRLYIRDAGIHSALAHYSDSVDEFDF
jgi:hypothetical protein